MKKCRLSITVLFILLASVTRPIIGTAEAAPVKPSLTITVHMIHNIDIIEDNDFDKLPPEWFYVIRVWNGDDWVTYERPTTVPNGVLTSNNVHTFHLENQMSNSTKFYIHLYEEDNFITAAEVADISSHPGVVQPSQRGTAPRGAQFYGVYNLISNSMTDESDVVTFDSTYHYTSGDFDGSNETDENDAILWFKISDNYEAPVAEAGEDKEDTLGQLMTFGGTGSTASAGSSIEKYEWDWESNGVYDRQGSSVGYTFPTKGVRTVTLRVTDSVGTTSLDTLTVNIINLVPNADFNLSTTQTTIYENVTFVDQSTDYDGEIDYWWWDFGDDAISNDRNPVHRYSRRGTYNISLTVWDDNGAIDTTHRIIEILNVDPKADFQIIPSMTKIEKQVSFTDKSTDPEGYPMEYLWDFGDGVTSTEKDPKHVYSLPGNMTVTLTVTDDRGAQSTVQKYIIIVPNVPPEADFSYSPENQLNNHDVVFKDLSEDEDGYINAWSWSFGDGVTSNLKDPIHKFPAGGNYSVQLTVTDENGDIDKVVQTVSIVQTYDLTIHVQDLFGSSITDAEVKVYGEKDWYKAGTTNEYGSFSLRELLVGQYTIETKVLGLTTSTEVELTENTQETMTVNVSMSTIGVALGVIAFAAIGVYFLTRRSKNVPVEE